jgi:hypothetical protein
MLILLLRLYYAGTLHNKRKNPAQNSKSSNVRKQTLSPFPQESTLYVLLFTVGLKCSPFALDTFDEDNEYGNFISVQADKHLKSVKFDKQNFQIPNFPKKKFQKHIK